MQSDKDNKAEQVLAPQDKSQAMRSSRIIVPILLGVAVVAYLFWRQFDPQEFARIDWTARLGWWLLVAVALAVVRHVAYALRLKVLTHGEFTFGQCVQLVFFWEFASAVSPTSVGGSAVAFFILNREKLSMAKATAVVLYTVVLDSLFLLLTLPVFYLMIGPGIMRPGATTFAETGAWGVYFVVAYIAMLAYSGLFFYGIFVGPQRVKRFLGAVTSWQLLRRFRRGAITLGNEFVIASETLRREHLWFHLEAFGYTAAAWAPRFLLLSAIIIAFVPELPLDAFTQFELYARLKTMFFVIAFSPTPGGAGLIELLFGGFLSDYVHSGTLSTVIATVWRALSYYVYLFAGALLIPGWLRRTASRV